LCRFKTGSLPPPLPKYADSNRSANHRELDVEMFARLRSSLRAFEAANGSTFATEAFGMCLAVAFGDLTRQGIPLPRSSNLPKRAGILPLREGKRRVSDRLQAGLTCIRRATPRRAIDLAVA
jgi:hypothetical protein